MFYCVSRSGTWHIIGEHNSLCQLQMELHMISLLVSTADGITHDFTHRIFHVPIKIFLKPFTCDNLACILAISENYWTC